MSRALVNGALEAWKIYVGKDEEDRTGLGRAELLYRSTDDAMLEVFLRWEHTKRYTWRG